jgi:hypothetical protein
MKKSNFYILYTIMKIDQDIIQRFKVIGIFTIQFYKITTGTMLTLFVPQACESDKGIIEICTLKENYENDELYHQITMYWNIFTFLCFMMCYLLELKREHWAIKYLDIDNNRPDNSLKNIIIHEPELDKRMDRLNKYYFYGFVGTSFCYFINIVLMIHILVKNYHSMSTISCFVSFVLLVNMKLYNSLNIGYQSVKNDKMMSAFMNEFVSYNVLDSDYLESRGLTDLSSSNRP